MCQKRAQKGRRQKSARKTVRKITLRNVRKVVKNVQKKTFGNTVKNVQTILWTEKQCLDRRQNHFESEKITEIFTLLGLGCLQPFVGVTDGIHFRGSVRTGARVCVRTSLPTCFPDEAHLYVRVLGYFLQVLLLLVLSLYWSKKGIVVENPWRCAFFGVSQKKLKNSNCFSRRCKPPHDKTKNRRKCCPFVNAKNGERSNTRIKCYTKLERWTINF